MATTMNLAGRRPRVVSAMSNGVVWVAAMLVLLFIGTVILGFRTRFAKKEHAAQATENATVAHDAAISNRPAVRNRAEATRPENGVAPPTRSSGPIPTAPDMIVGASRTEAQPFSSNESSSIGTLSGERPVPYYYLPPQPSSYSQYTISSAASDDPVKKARLRAQERREAAINAPTGIIANANTASGSVAKSLDPIQAELERIAQLSGTANRVQRPAISGLYPPIGGPAAVSEEYDLNEQNGKRAFQQGDKGDYLPTIRVAPVSRWVVERGDRIVAIMPLGIVTDLPGDLTAQVKDSVYDSPTHRYILIPAGSLLGGEYNSSVSYGQGRVQVIWTYLRFPDGSFINLDKFVSHAADGAVGLKDQTDNHIRRLVGGVLLSSIFAAGVQISQNRSGTNSTLAYPSTTQIAASAVGQQASHVGEQITSRNLNVQPTLKIRPGEPFYVSVQKSMVFSGPYEPMKLGVSQ